MPARVMVPQYESAAEAAGSWLVAAAGRSLQAVLNAPTFLYLFTLAVMLFRPPDVDLHHLDRIAFGVLVLVTMLRAIALREPLFVSKWITLPMIGLAALSAGSLFRQPYDAQAWSLFAAKFAVPFVLFHLATRVFATEASLRKFDYFAMAVLAYLIFVAIASTTGPAWVIFPKYILDESLGIHVDRARGPFLQAVANGVTLTLLGLFALDSYRRGLLRGAAAALIAASLPLAIVATMTRAVWVGFAAAVFAALFVIRDRPVRRVCMALIAVALAAVAVACSFSETRGVLLERTSEAGPIEIRAAVYRASWEMIRERPLLGWGENQMAAEVADRMPDYELDAYFAHNSYLEILVEQGIVGLAFYVALIVGLFRLGRSPGSISNGCSAIPLLSVWPIALSVYLFNGLFVVMNYQFVNALVFTMAGILASEQLQTTPHNRECAS